MPGTIITTASGLGAEIAKRLAADTRLVELAALEACQGGLRDVVQTTNKEGLVDQGLFKLSWSAHAVPRGAAVENTAPYAAVLEHGRRPNRPGPPLAPIYAWVQRKMRGAVKGQYRVARALALGLARGTAGSASFRRAAVRHVREQFGNEGYRVSRKGGKEIVSGTFGAVDARLMGIAMKIRDHIHYRGTRPRKVLGQNMPKLRARFGVAALRQLRRRK